MDIELLLKKVLKAKTGLIVKKLNTSSKISGPSLDSSVSDTVPNSLTQLLSKYSPRNSPKAFKHFIPQTKINSILLLKKLLSFSIKKKLIIWKKIAKVPYNNPETNKTDCKVSKKLKRKFILSKNVNCKLNKVKSQTSFPTLPPSSPASPYKKFVFSGEKALNSYSSREKTIKKLESCLKFLKTARNLQTSTKLSILKTLKRLSLGSKLQQKLCKLLNPNLKQIINSITIRSKVEICPSNNISITPVQKKTHNLSVVQENSFNLLLHSLNPAKQDLKTNFLIEDKNLPSRNIFSPLNLNKRYSDLDPSDSKIMTFDLSPQQSFDLPNFSDFKSLSYSSLDKSEIQFQLEENEECGAREGYKEMQDDSIVELEDGNGSARREMSPILTFSHEFKIEFKNGIKSTSTMSISSTDFLARKPQTLCSKEDTVDQIPFCEKSDSVELFPGLKKLEMLKINQESLESHKNLTVSDIKIGKTKKNRFIVKKIDIDNGKQNSVNAIVQFLIIYLRRRIFFLLKKMLAVGKLVEIKVKAIKYRFFQSLAHYPSPKQSISLKFLSIIQKILKNTFGILFESLSNTKNSKIPSVLFTKPHSRTFQPQKKCLESLRSLKLAQYSISTLKKNLENTKKIFRGLEKLAKIIRIKSHQAFSQLNYELH